ncbi:potassium channel family protein [Methanolacinia paynteri]|uniref:potassium channel family protein n=1 Tax=Methanolacinia paynteri TaxID=230356 RepID=UPI001FE233ED|nr:NAD-binding protein [Methanolacinia paynteri]
MQDCQGDEEMKRNRIIRRLNHFLFRDRLNFYIELLIFQIIFYSILLYYAIPYLEGTRLTLPESVLFVMQTMTTVGYDLLTFFPTENPLTIIIIIIIMSTGVFTVLMIIPAAMAPFIQEVFRPQPPVAVSEKISGHVIITGYDELVKSLIESLLVSSLRVVLVEEDENKAFAAMNDFSKFKKEIYVISGSYDENETWTGADIATAAKIIICEQEYISSKIILGIRDRTTAEITAVVDRLLYGRYLLYAGADHIISPKDVTGRILARHASLTPEVDIIYEATKGNRIRRAEVSENSLKFVYITVSEGCGIIGRTLDELNLYENYGVEPIFIMKKGHFYFEKGENVSIDRSTTIFLLGRTDSITKLFENELKCSIREEKLAVISGYGDLGRVVESELEKAGVQPLVIDPNIDEITGIKGDAQEESVLKAAHIDKAEACITAADDDDVNIFTTLIARNLNPGLHILSRANKSSSVEKLYRAGADYVALLPTLGGQIIAATVLQDIVSILLDLPKNMKVVMKHITEDISMSVGECERMTGAKIIGIEGPNHTLIRPPPETNLENGDSVIAFGDYNALKKLIKLLSGEKYGNIMRRL